MKLIGKILILLSLLFILISLFLYYKNNKVSNDMIIDYIETTKTETNINEDKDIIESTEENKNIPQKNDIEYTAILEIPSINLKRGLVDSKGNFNIINKAIGIDENSTYPDKYGNLILYAHSGNSSISYFKNLNKIKISSNINIYYNGIIYQYKVFDIYNIEKNGKANILITDKTKYITLITCNPKEKNKQIVILGEIVNEIQY